MVRIYLKHFVSRSNIIYIYIYIHTHTHRVEIINIRFSLLVNNQLDALFSMYLFISLLYMMSTGLLETSREGK